MRNVIVNRITPQDKNINVNDRFGNTGIRQQQGTSVTKYDTLPLDGRTTLNFFEGSGARNFPLSNAGSDGNKLGVGNTLVIERLYFTVLEKITPIFPGVPYFETLNNQGQLLNLGAFLGTIGVIYSELNFSIANSTVLRNFPIMSTLPTFNYSSTSDVENVYNLDTNIVVPPLLEYVGQLRIPTYIPSTERELFLRLTIEGSGSIIAPRTTF
jgi:hypothetical protein